MPIDIHWKSKEYNSEEHCSIEITESGIIVSSEIKAEFENRLFSLTYSIHCNPQWETIFFEMHQEPRWPSGDIQARHHYTADGKGHWFKDGKPAHALTGCIDIDIVLTPLTNTLPVRRLKLDPNEQRQIQVLYVDVLEGTITSVYQRYTKLRQNVYKFETVPNDFEADIIFDDNGFVVSYPGLFDRVG